MFDLVQKYRRVIQVVLGLIALTFATWGIESYTRFRGGADTIATVNGMEIPRREFDQELGRQQEQLRQMFGPQFNAEAFDTPESRRVLLDGLISQRLMSSVAVRSYLTVSDDTLYQTIASIPAFQRDGRYDPETAKIILRSQNPPMTPEQYVARLRHDLALQQLLVRAHQHAHVLDVDQLGAAREAHEVCGQHADDPPLAPLARGRREWRCAGHAKARLSGIVRATARARDHRAILGR